MISCSKQFTAATISCSKQLTAATISCSNDKQRKGPIRCSIDKQRKGPIRCSNDKQRKGLLRQQLAAATTSKGRAAAANLKITGYLLPAFETTAHELATKG
jgi:hypothetical protein